MRPSPLQNRVRPDGEIIAVAARGLMYGNRGGPFHGPDQRLHPKRRWGSRQWLCCVLTFKGRRRTLMQPGRFTELFFLDEATAFAAGHRPCFECRRADAVRFRHLWMIALGLERMPKAADMDRVLHSERVAADGRKRVHAVDGRLPAGAFVETRELGAALVIASIARDRVRVARWSPDGYGPVEHVALRSVVHVLTPPTTVAILRSGYRPVLHPSAQVVVMPPV